MVKTSRICAVICEYDPFHNGHRHHLAEARRLFGADYIVCIMSGVLTQRGTFARYDKYIRARSALLNGADLVLELPVRFSCASAQEFAAGSVAIANGLNLCSALSFGCEPDLIPLLPDLAAILKTEPSEFKDALRAHLSLGMSYPAAHAAALQDCLSVPGLAPRLSAPNAILALEYLKALPDTIVPVPVPRIGAYHGTETGPFASAGALRIAAESGTLCTSAQAAMPDPSPYLDAEAYGWIHPLNALSDVLLYQIRTSRPESLAAIHGMAEGIHNRFMDCATETISRESLISAIKNKRFTYARLSRICSSILLDLTSEKAHALDVPQYARILGFRRTAAPLLSALKAAGDLPLIDRARDLPKSSTQYLLDHRAQILWSLGCKNPEYRTGNRDLSAPTQII